VFEHEATHPDRVYLTQPLGGSGVADYTWAQALDQARRMAAHLQAQGLPRGARVAILSKNCAHFIIAELAIWLGGYTTVAIFPTEGADTVRFVLEHSEASLLFVGKLDTWPQQRPGVPKGLPCIALPLARAEDRLRNLGRHRRDAPRRWRAGRSALPTIWRCCCTPRVPPARPRA
jgi:long-chain acyl-CoA synthetase